MGDVDGMDRVDVNVDALKSEIRRAIINQKANACVPLLTISSFVKLFAEPYDQQMSHSHEDGVARGWHL